MCELSLSSELNRMPSIASLFRLYFDRQTMGIIRIIIIFLIKRGVGIISSYLQLTFPLDSSSRRQKSSTPTFYTLFFCSSLPFLISHLEYLIQLCISIVNICDLLIWLCTFARSLGWTVKLFQMRFK